MYFMMVVHFGIYYNELFASSPLSVKIENFSRQSCKYIGGCFVFVNKKSKPKVKSIRLDEKVIAEFETSRY